MFVTPARCKYDYYFKSGKHSCDIQNWESPLEEEFVEMLGIALFKLPSVGTEPPQGYRDMCIAPLSWEAGCFKDNKARLELQDTQNGVATVSLQTKDGNNWYCEDKYMFVTPARCKYDYYFKSGKHSRDIQNWESPLEEEFVEKLGIALFKLPSVGTEPPQGYRDM
nr:hypothetical protein CFP56_72236 [Quercus suber]